MATDSTLADLCLSGVAALETLPVLRGRIEFILRALTGGVVVRAWSSAGWTRWQVVGICGVGVLAAPVDGAEAFPVARVIQFEAIEFPDDLGGCERAREALAKAPAVTGTH